jgi:hypothetical protein
MRSVCGMAGGGCFPRALVTCPIPASPARSPGSWMGNEPYRHRRTSQTQIMLARA